MDKLNYGDVIEFIGSSHTSDVEVKKILNVVPAKYDGIKSEYIVTDQAHATHMCIVMECNDGHISYIMLSVECENAYLLIDAIVG